MRNVGTICENFRSGEIGDFLLGRSELQLRQLGWSSCREGKAGANIGGTQKSLCGVDVSKKVLLSIFQFSIGLYSKYAFLI